MNGHKRRTSHTIEFTGVTRTTAAFYLAVVAATVQTIRAATIRLVPHFV